MLNLFAPYTKFTANLLSLFAPAFDASSRLLAVYCVHAPLRVSQDRASFNPPLLLAPPPAQHLEPAVLVAGSVLANLHPRQAQTSGRFRYREVRSSRPG
jgi:hypothetical protein